MSSEDSFTAIHSFNEHLESISKESVPLQVEVPSNCQGGYAHEKAYEKTEPSDGVVDVDFTVTLVPSNLS